MSADAAAGVELHPPARGGLFDTRRHCASRLTVELAIARVGLEQKGTGVQLPQASSCGVEDQPGVILTADIGDVLIKIRRRPWGRLPLATTYVADSGRATQLGQTRILLARSQYRAGQDEPVSAAAAVLGHGEVLPRGAGNRDPAQPRRGCGKQRRQKVPRVAPPAGNTAVTGAPSNCAMRATAIPPPPGSCRGGPHNISSVVIVSMLVVISSAGFIVNVAIALLDVADSAAMAMVFSFRCRTHAGRL